MIPSFLHATRRERLPQQPTGLVLVPSIQGGGNSSPIGGIFKAVMKVDSGCLSSFVDRKLAADVVPGFRSAERRTTAKYRPLEDVLDQLKQDLFFSPVAIPERFLVVREEGERLQGKYTCHRQYKHQQPGTTAVLEASQQLTEPKLAGPWRISGLLDDLEEPLAGQARKN
ncbi:hypothetical protein quinque_007532 [Culex quinquefasciatus]